MNKTKLRVLSLFLVVVLMVGVLPMPALAAAAEPDTQSQEAEPTESPSEETPPVSPPDGSPPATSPQETEAAEPTLQPPVEPTEPAETTSPTETEPTQIQEESTEPSASFEPPMEEPTAEEIMLLNGANTIWFQGYVYRVNENAPRFRRTYKLKDGSHTTNLDHMYIMRLVAGGHSKPAYCLEPDTEAKSGVDYGSGKDEGVDGNWLCNLTPKQQRAVGLAMLYSNIHHPDPLRTIESVEWEVATQIIIWEIVMGMRDSNPPYKCTNSALINQFNGKIRYHGEIGGPGKSNHYLTGVKAKYDTLSSDLSLHEVIPSFTERRISVAPIYTMEQQSNGSFSVSLTDSNSVLSHYNFPSQSPITISQSGNNLRATAPKGATWKDLSFTATRKIPNPESSSCLFRVFYKDKKNQTLIVSPDKVPYDPVPAYFKLKAGYPPGTATIQKTSELDVEGYCFKLFHKETYRSWYGKTDRSGRMFQTNDKYDTKTGSYEWTGLEDGDYSFKEALSVHGAGKVFPTSWRITVTNREGKITYDRTFSGEEIYADPYGDAKIKEPYVHLTGLSYGGKLTMTIHNSPKTGYIEVMKKDDIGNPVAGAKFLLTNMETNETFPLGPTNSRGYAITSEIPFGRYRVEETRVPQGYIRGSMPDMVTLSDAAPNRTLTFNAVNPRIKGHIQLTKVDATDGKPLTGAVFQVTFPDGSRFNMIEGKNGVHSLRDLPYGTYKVQEVKAPTGYILDETVYTVRITENGKTYFVKVNGKVPNNPIRGHIQLTKVDSTDGMPLTGAVFQVTFPDGSTKNMVEGKNGVHSLRDLRFGTYKVQEIKAPTGYILDETVYTVRITENGKTYFVATNGKVPNNPIRGHIQLTKVDATDGKPLTGAVFQVTCPDGSTKNMVEGKNGVHSLRDLRYGRYTVQEIQAPEGFQLDPTVYTVEITENGKTYFVATNGKVPNNPIRGHIQLTKVDATDGKPLTGAVFQVTFPDGSTKNMVEGEDGVHSLRDLRYGKYTVQEIQAPEGFQLDPTVYTVEITENGKTYEVKTPGHEGVSNPPVPGSISIQKVDTHGNSMSGVTFKLEFSLDDGSTWNPVTSRVPDAPMLPGTSSTLNITDGELTTDADGKITYAGLRINSQTGNIRYRLTEIATTNGHTLLAGTAFDGYLSQDDLVDIQINATNGTGFELPIAGGYGTQALTAASAVFLLMAAVIQRLNKKQYAKGEGKNEDQ